MNEIELAKIGVEMYVKIFNDFGGWFMVSALVCGTAILTLSLRTSK